MALILASCGDSELKLHRPSSVTSDLVINVTQEGDRPWLATYEKGPRNPNDILPLGKTITLRFSADEDGHTLFIPELGINLFGLSGQTSQSWFTVHKPVEVYVRCDNHPEENTELTLRFE